jgi:hypothetical protein
MPIVNSTNYVFIVNISGGNFSELGIYHKGINCLTIDKKQGGVLTQSFEITFTGNQPAEGIVIVIFSIIFIALFFFALLSFFKALELAISFNMDLIDVATLMGTYFSMWFFYYINSEYLGNALMNTILEMAISIGAVTHVFLPMVAFLVSFIMTNLQAKRKAKVTY